MKYRPDGFDAEAIAYSGIVDWTGDLTKDKARHISIHLVNASADAMLERLRNEATERTHNPKGCLVFIPD